MCCNIVNSGFLCLLPVGLWLHSDSLPSLHSFCGLGRGSAWNKGSNQVLTEWKRRIKKHTCRFCGKGFVLRQDHDGHVNCVHLKTKPYVCDKCQASFANKRYLVDHKKRCTWNLQTNEISDWAEAVFRSELICSAVWGFCVWVVFHFGVPCTWQLLVVMIIIHIELWVVLFSHNIGIFFTSRIIC